MVNRQQSDLDRLADLVVERLLSDRGLPGQDGPGREVFGPVGAPVPGLPEIPGPEELPNLYPRARLAIDGIELTQSIQHYGTGYGADNSVPIVALKPLAVRAYAVVRPALFGPDPLSGQFVTGTLILSRWGKEVFRTGPTRAGGARLGTIELLRRDLWDTELTYWLGGGGPGGAVAALTQFKRNCPLNFIVPAWYLRKGRMIATLALHTESGATVAEDIDFDVIDVPAPRVALVRVNWTSAANATSSPTDEEMLETLSLAGRMMPFPYFDTRILSAELDETGNFWMPVAAGDCNPRWNDLLEELTELRFWVRLFQLADIVYGIVPAAANQAPAGSTVNSGCGDADNGVAASFAGLGRSFAHELGHIYGREHVAVAGDPDNDPDYPRYGGDPRAIGEVGVDLGESPVAIYSPPRSNDIMAYWDANSPDDEKWISPYTYRALIDERFRHASTTASAARFAPFLVMRFRVFRLAAGGSQFERLAVHRITAPGIAGAARPQRRQDREDSVTIDFVDKQDRTVYTHWCRQAHTSASCGCCGNGANRSRRDVGWASYVEAIAWPDVEGTRLLVRKGDEVIAELPIGEPPSVSIETRTGDRDTIRVTVKASHRRVTPSTVLLFTHDDGRTWEPVSLRVPLDGSVEVPLSRLKGGSRCRFRAVSTAELQAAEASTENFELPERGRTLYLRLRAPRCAGEMATLSALVDARGHGMCLPGEVCWRSSLDGDIGRGLHLAVALSDGTHEVTASIPDGLGGTASETGVIRMGTG